VSNAIFEELQPTFSTGRQPELSARLGHGSRLGSGTTIRWFRDTAGTTETAWWIVASCFLLARLTTSRHSAIFAPPSS
jgi:hypothetical protein